jgi:uncharacterized protein
MTERAVRSHTLAQAILRGLAAALLAVAAAWPQVAEIPYMTGRITDNAEILSSEARARITELLKAHEEANTDQVAVLTLPSLEGIRLEEFAARVFQEWKLGDKGKDNGVLLLVSPGDRRIRIEVGSGLSGKLADASAVRIIRDVMTPRFQEGDYNQGMEAGLRAIINQLEGNERTDAAPPEREDAGSVSSMEDPDLPIHERILIGAFIFSIIGIFTIFGVVTPGAGWFLYVFLIPFWAMFPIIVVGTRGAFILLIIYLVGFPVAKLSLSHASWLRGVMADFQSKGGAQIGGFAIKRGARPGSSWSSR